MTSSNFSFKTTSKAQLLNPAGKLFEKYIQLVFCLCVAFPASETEKSEEEEIPTLQFRSNSDFHKASALTIELQLAPKKHCYWRDGIDQV